MSRKTFQLVYMSEINDELVTNIDETFKDISSHSSRKNAKFGVTGMLFYRNGFFIQILEGQKEFVNDIYKKILKDKRHRNVRVLLTKFSKERVYSSWGMSYEHIQIVDEKSLLMSYMWDNIILSTNNNYNVNYNKLFSFFNYHLENS